MHLNDLIIEIISPTHMSHLCPQAIRYTVDTIRIRIWERYIINMKIIKCILAIGMYWGQAFDKLLNNYYSYNIHIVISENFQNAIFGVKN